MYLGFMLVGIRVTDDVRHENRGQPAVVPRVGDSRPAIRDSYLPSFGISAAAGAPTPPMIAAEFARRAFSVGIPFTPPTLMAQSVWVVGQWSLIGKFQNPSEPSGPHRGWRKSEKPD